MAAIGDGVHRRLVAHQPEPRVSVTVPIEGQGRDQKTRFPECLEDWVDDDNPVRVIDASVDSLDLGGYAPDRVVTPRRGE